MTKKWTEIERRKIHKRYLNSSVGSKLDNAIAKNDPKQNDENTNNINQNTTKKTQD